MSTRRRIMMQSKGGGRLPKEYQEVKYLIGGSQSAYLVIDFPVDSTCGISVDCKWPDSAYGAIFAGNTLGLNGTRIGGTHSNNGSYIYSAFKSAFSFSSKNEYSTKKNVKLNYKNNGLLIVDTYGYDTRTMSAPSKIGTDSAFQLFVNIYNKTQFGWSHAGQYIYDFELTKMDDVVMHLIPCYRKSDKEPGMYDIINNKFHTNVGTGKFAIGPAV